MQTQIHPTTGNLTFILEGNEAGEIAELMHDEKHHLDHGVLAAMLERFGFSTNGRYMPIMPEDVSALTDSPMFSNDVEYLEDGTRKVVGDIWWFPSYEVEYFAGVLCRQGQVTFTRAH